MDSLYPVGRRAGHEGLALTVFFLIALTGVMPIRLVTELLILFTIIGRFFTQACDLADKCKDNKSCASCIRNNLFAKVRLYFSTMPIVRLDLAFCILTPCSFNNRSHAPLNSGPLSDKNTFGQTRGHSGLL